MLTPSEAEARLARWRDDGWAASRLRAARLLSPAVAGLVESLLAPTPGDSPQMRLATRQQAVAALNDADRHELWALLCPALAAVAERVWWQLADCPDFQGGQLGFPVAAGESLAADRRLSFLISLCRVVGPYNPTAPWLAAWAAHLGERAQQDGVVSVLLAAAIDRGDAEGDEVLGILADTAAGRHAIGAMGNHVIWTLLRCARPEGWQCLVRLLLEAQREEGLRLAVLERAHRGHPGAFRLLLTTILDHGLVRFSSVVQAVDGWFGLGWEALGQQPVEQAVRRVMAFLDDPAECQAALAGEDGPDCHLALWALARVDGNAALDRARAMLCSPDAARRLIAVRLLSVAGRTDAIDLLTAALDDEDLRVALAAAERLRRHDWGGRAEWFEATARLLMRLPRGKVTLPPLVYPWWAQEADANALAWWVFGCRGDRPADVLLPLWPHLNAEMRWRLLFSIQRGEAISPAVRAFLLARLSDASSKARGAAVALLAETRIAPDEAAPLEALLSRRPPDLRRGVLRLLQNQDDELALASARRLVEDADELRRLGGLELLRSLAAAGRRADDCRALAAAYRLAHPALTVDEQSHLAALGAESSPPPSPANAFGLIDPADLIGPLVPSGRAVIMATPAALALRAALSAAIAAQAATMVTFDTELGPRRGPLGEAEPPRLTADKLSAAQRTTDGLPLLDHWLAWYEGRPAEWRDADGCELVRAAWLGHLVGEGRHARDPWYAAWYDDLLADAGPLWPRASGWEAVILSWLLALAPPPVEAATALLLAAGEDALARLPETAHTVTQGERGWDVPLLWYTHSVFEPLRQHARLWPDAVSAEAWRQVLGWQTWAGTAWSQADEQGRRQWWCFRPEAEDVLPAFTAGGAGEADVINALIGPLAAGGSPGLRLCTRRRPPESIARDPRLGELAARCARRVLAVELARGDQPSGATVLVNYITAMVGSDVLLAIVRGLGKDRLARPDTYDRSRGFALSRLLRRSWPGDEDTPEVVGGALRSPALPERLLCEAAMVAPQWSAHIGAALGWPGFASGVWWLHAHTKCARAETDEEMREAWAAEVAAHSPLAAGDLLDGAVDVGWFATMIAELGEERFGRLYEAARLGSSTGGHTRARLFADAMLGRVDAAALTARVADTRHQDSLRALGLVPLPAGAARETELLTRYGVIVELERTSREFGAQRQASEKRAAAVALDNLARTAGYPDPLRLRWAMEAHAVADLRDGPVVVAVGEVQVALSIGPNGRPELTATKAGKALRSIPGAVGKDPAVATLKDRKADLDRAASRMSAALEESMCRGDAFTGGELSQLLGHPLLAPRLARLVWCGEGITGYTEAGGQALRDHAGTLHPLGRAEPVRLAHPLDLLAAGDWHLWQRECMAAERVQPFKQVFREVYPLTATEREAGHRSQRYAGHQLHPRQALGLFGRRGWVNDLELGVRRTWHEAGLTGCVEFADWWYTPADLEGLTIETVRFVTKGEERPVPLADVPPMVFSEAMRDLDLVVSVAHRGGVDPDATASTIELRAALLRELCASMGIGNVRIDGHHVLIDGQLGRYSVHLGSAVAHLLPGGMLVIVPVHGQHRGRLFLPFADDDPRTAEVLSKVLLLARDEQIKDPSILSAIRG